MKKNISTVDESINTTPVSVMMMNMDPFVTYEEGAKYFRLGLNTFQDMAYRAGACYKHHRRVIVNLRIFREYLETFRITP